MHVDSDEVSLKIWSCYADIYADLKTNLISKEMNCHDLNGQPGFDCRCPNSKLLQVASC